MLNVYINADVIRLNVECGSWQEAVAAGCQPLLDKGCVEPSYLAAIIRNHLALGAYMVIAPGIMLAHARPEDGVKQVSLSLVTLKEPLAFGNETNDPVKLILTLASTDKEAHLVILAKLMELLLQASEVEAIMQAQQVQEVLAIIANY